MNIKHIENSNPPFQGVIFSGLLVIRRPLPVFCDDLLEVIHDRRPEFPILKRKDKKIANFSISTIQVWWVFILSLNKICRVVCKQFSKSTESCRLHLNLSSYLTRAAKMATLEAEAMARRRWDMSTSHGAESEISPTIRAWNVYELCFDIILCLIYNYKSQASCEIWTVTLDACWLGLTMYIS